MEPQVANSNSHCLPRQCHLGRPPTPTLFAMVSAAHVWAPCRLPLSKLNHIGVFEHVADAHVDTLAGARTQYDLIVTSGGVSTGDEDHVKSAVERLGILHFWRLAIKPGRPVALGQVGGVPLIGLPGNPVAVIITFAVLARPLIAKLAGARACDPRSFPVRAGFAYRKKPGRREYLRASLERKRQRATRRRRRR